MVDDAERFVRFTFSSGSAWDHVPPPNAPGAAPECAEPPRPTQARPAAALAIARVHISQLSPGYFDEHFRLPGVPCVIEGALESGADHWRLGTFIERFGPNDAYQCRIHGGDSFATSPDMWRGKSHARHVVLTTPRKFADTISSGIAHREDCYVQADIQGTNAGAAVAAHLEELGRRTGLAVHRRYGAMVNMWWGPGGHTEPLHMDATDGTLCQLRGRKRIALFPPRHWPDLYPFPATDGGMSWAFSQVKQATPDLKRFPRLAGALEQRIDVDLEEGEILFIPACCAHEITGQPSLADGSAADHVLSVNRFWRTDPQLVRPHLPPDAAVSYENTMAIFE